MKLSIIVPNYNNSKTVINTIKSIYSSIGINKYSFEIIIVDDASTDDSVELINKKFPTVRIIKQEKNKGASGARNKGIKESKGNLLLFIDSDMWFNRSSISMIMDSLNKEIDIVFPKIVYKDGQVMYPVLDIEKKYSHITGCFFIRKESLERLDEYFDEFYETYLEDYDFFIKCKLRNLKAKYVEKSVVIHADKISRDYSKRYYLEMRNTLYGILKLGRLAKKSKLYNPFTLKAFFKGFVCGVFNFAWFNWQGYDRESNKTQILFSNKNKITNKPLRLVFLFLKAILDVLKNLRIVFKKRKALVISVSDSH